MGSRLTRPQARAATPLQLRATATMPIESGPGCKERKYYVPSKTKFEPLKREEIMSEMKWIEIKQIPSSQSSEPSRQQFQ